MHRIPRAVYTKELRDEAVKLALTEGVGVELAQVKRELAKVKMERDLLKNIATYFAKESR